MLCPNHVSHDQHDQDLVSYQAIGNKEKCLEFDQLVWGNKIPIMAFDDLLEHQLVVQHTNDRNEVSLDFD